MSVPTTSRIKVLDTPVLDPGVCGLCGTSQGPVIDFGKQLDWYGAVYFCFTCIREAAQAVDYIPVAEFNALYEELRALKVTHAQLTSKFEKYSAVEDEFRNMYELANGTVTKPLDSDSAVVVETSEPDIEPDGISVKGDTKADESSELEGSDDFFDASDYE